MKGWALIAATVLLLSAADAFAQSQFQSSKTSPGIVVQGDSLSASKISPGIVLQGSSFNASKLSPGVVLQSTSFQSSKMSVGVVVQTVSNSGIIVRAPLTHW